MIRTFALLMVLAVGMPVAESRADDGFHPVDVGEGPLLLFYRPESANGDPYSNPNDRVDTLYVFDPASPKKPQLVWRGEAPPFARPVALVQKQTVVFELDDRIFLLDLKTGKTTNLRETKNQVEVVSVEHGKVYFVEHQERQKSFGFKLGTGDDDKTVVEDYFRPRDVLYVCNTTKPSRAKKLADLKIEKILLEDDKHFWAVTFASTGRGRKICKISKSGGGEVVAPFPNGWVASLANIKLSPKKKYLAVASIHEKHDFHTERELIVVGLNKKEIVLSKSALKNKIRFGCCNTNIGLDWPNDNVLFFDGALGFAFDITTGEKATVAQVEALRAATYSSDIKEKERIGFFDLSHGEAFLKGEEKPIASVLDESGAMVRDLVIDEKGLWVAFASVKNSELFLVDGQTQKKNSVTTGWTYDLQWLRKSMSRNRITGK